MRNKMKTPANREKKEQTKSKYNPMSYVLLFTSACFFAFGVPAKLFVFFFYVFAFWSILLLLFVCVLPQFVFICKEVSANSFCLLSVFSIEFILCILCGCAVGVSLLYCFSLACLVLVAVGLVSGCPLCSAFFSTIRIVEIKVKW